ncbi:MAG: malto-oligosyltrehalose trehalohydrolase [Terriglobia bacterium]
MSGEESQPSVSVGATILENRDAQFLVWAPRADGMEVRILAPQARQIRMVEEEHGYYRAIAEGIEPNSRYVYRLSGKTDRPDPASRFQPEGVHGPSQIVNPREFHWTDGEWPGLPLEEYVLYEIHTGVFTPEGTFEAMVPRLSGLKKLGVTAIEIMPVAQFPGSRNWGYDGAYPFAAQNTYGGPVGFQKLVNACHEHHLAVVLDVVYNHLGPEGNYLAEYGPYFTDRYRTPWGSAVNFDRPESDEVRRFFIESAIYWLEGFHIDALRLDAIHGIVDTSARPFLSQLTGTVRSLESRQGRKIHLIAESSLNDVRVLRPVEQGGYGFDTQWNDDFHHALHALLTAERSGYYADFGRLDDLVKALREGYVYSGQYSRFRRRHHGNSSREYPPRSFVVYAQNHDQVGNRALGDRLSRLVSFEALKLAAGIALLSPFIPLLFMGEEYAEKAPFQYFTDHSDPELAEAVRKGRAEEFTAFNWEGQIPDPQDEQTFLRSKLDELLQLKEPHRTLWEFYQLLIELRRKEAGLANPSNAKIEVNGMEDAKVLVVRRWSASGAALMFSNFSKELQRVEIPCPPGRWQKKLDSAEERWLGNGSLLPGSVNSQGQIQLEMSPFAFVLFGQP